ncbi:unnamed protein product [Rotaria sp. Silwood2]|nr:unnamed protein product [Rotaria sp. Silwood2]CAF4148766.1 unnamed protein product [Rotaria sp. Silwood2]
MNFEIISANLQHQHIYQDGLHPSIESGSILIEKTLYNWFTTYTQRLSSENNHRNLRQKHQQRQHNYLTNDNSICHPSTKQKQE